MEFDKKHLGKEVVIISTNETLIVTFVIVAKDAKIRKTAELMSKLLSADHEYDYIKVGFDGDGDMFVRIDAPVRVTDATQMKADIDQVANTADELYEKVGSFVMK